MSILARAALASMMLFALPIVASAQIALGISINVAPPILPVYEQPPMPDEGYLWTPGYWAYGEDGYYWVPGTWILPPTAGYLWTPGYWGADGGDFQWHDGYWGETVGFYGGVNYGFGYGGRGYEGGYWRGGQLFYNHSVTNFGSVHVTHVYNRTVINNMSIRRVSFNGGSGGTHARATADELAAARGPHVEATAGQRQHIEAARSNPSLRFSANKGRPSIAATSRPGELTGAHVVAARTARTAPHAAGAPSATRATEHTTAPREPSAPREAPAQHAAPAAREPTPQREVPAQRAAPPEREAPAQREAPAHTAPSRPAAPPSRPAAEHAPPAHAPAEHAPQEHAEQQHSDDHEHHSL